MNGLIPENMAVVKVSRRVVVEDNYLRSKHPESQISECHDDTVSESLAMW